MPEPTNAHEAFRRMAHGWVERDGFQHYTGPAVEGQPIDLGTAEIVTEAEVAHRLMDWMKVPDGPPQGGGDLDSRVAALVWDLMAAQAYLSAIAQTHVQGSPGGGTVDGFCMECDRPWPCPTNLWATGQRQATDCWHPDDDEPSAPEPSS